MGYIQPTAMGAKGAAGSAHTPGTIDKIFNTTFGIIQQPLWRIWRALKDENIDVLSQKGILDPALLPILGFAFDNKNTVMADELFGDNLGAQIAGSILTDPLSFATGGVTATAKAARATSKGLMGGAKKAGKKAIAGDTTEAFHRAANFGSGRLDDVAEAAVGDAAFRNVADNSTVADMLLGINHAKKNGGFLDEAGNMLGKSLSPKELDDLSKLGNQLGGLTDDFLGGTVGNLLKEQKKREMGLGLPLLGDFFGMYVAPPKWLSKHGGWMKWYMNTVKSVYATPLKLTGKMIDPVMRMNPFLKKTATLTKNVVEQFSKGAKEGPMTNAVRDFFKNGSNPLLNATDRKFVAGSTATKIYNQAYVNVGGGKLPLNRHQVQISEHVDILAKNLEEEAVLNNLTFNQQVQRRFGKDAIDQGVIVQRAGVEDSIQAFKDSMGSFLYKKEASALGSETMVWDDDLMKAVVPETDYTAAYKLGRATRTFYNKVFKNDLGLNGAEELNRFQRRMEAQHSQHQEAMAHRFYAKIEEVAKQTGKSTEAINQIMYARLALTSSADEIHSFVDYLNGGGSTTMKQWGQELNQFLGGRVNSNLDYLKGTAAENMRGGTAAMEKLIKDLEAGVSEAIELPDIKVWLNRLSDEGTEAVSYERNIGKVQEMSLSAPMTLGDQSLVGRAITTVEPRHLFGSTKTGELGKAGKGGVFGRMTELEKELNKYLSTQDKSMLGSDTLKLIGEDGRPLNDSVLELLAKVDADKSALTRWRAMLEDMDDFKVARPELIAAGRLRPTLFKKVNHLGEFKDGGKISLDDFGKAEKNNVGKAFGDAGADLEGMTGVISRLRTRQAALDQYINLHGGILDNNPRNIPAAFIEGFEEDLNRLSGLMRDAVMKPLSVGKTGKTSQAAEELFQMFDSQRDATRLMGIKSNILPHSATPLGYMPRISSGKEFEVISKALNDFVGDSEGLKNLLTPTLASARKQRYYTVHDINRIETELRKLPPEGTGQNLEAMLERITAAREKLTGSADFKKYTEDPTAAIVAHHSQMAKALQDQEWFGFIAKEGHKYGISQGRIVDIIMDSGATRHVELAPGTEIPLIRTGQAGKAAAVGEEAVEAVADYVPPTKIDSGHNSAADVLQGVRVSNTGKTDFEMLMPDNYWARDGHEAVEGAHEAKAILGDMYKTGSLNESGVLMVREAIRHNPALMKNLTDTDLPLRTGEIMQAMQRQATGAGKIQSSMQASQAQHLMATLGVAAMKGMDEVAELSSARASIIRDHGEQGFVDWAMKQFKVTNTQARRAMQNGDDFVGMVTASALTKVGEKGLHEAGLGKFVKSFQNQMKAILNKVIETFTGGKKGFMDHKMHSELALQLEQTVKGALKLSDSAEDAVLNTRARQGVIDFISNSYHNSLKPILDSRMRQLGLADGFSAFAARTAQSRADMLLNVLDYKRVASTLGVKGVKELEKYLDQVSTMPKFTYEEASALEGLSQPTRWSQDASVVMEDALGTPQEYQSMSDFLGSVAERMSGRTVRDVLGEDFDDAYTIGVNPFDLRQGSHTGEVDQLAFLLPRLSKTELRKAGFYNKALSSTKGVPKRVPVPLKKVKTKLSEEAAEAVKAAKLQKAAVISLKKQLKEVDSELGGFADKAMSKADGERAAKLAKDKDKYAKRLKTAQGKYAKAKAKADELKGPPEFEALDEIPVSYPERLPFEEVNINMAAFDGELHDLAQLYSEHLRKAGLDAYAERTGKIGFDSKVTVGEQLGVGRYLDDTRLEEGLDMRQVAELRKPPQEIVERVTKLVKARNKYVKSLEVATEKARKLYKKRVAKEYGKNTVKEFDSNLKVLDAVIDDLVKAPQIAHREAATDFVAHAKLNHKDIQRISNELIGEGGEAMSKTEVTSFQRKLYNYLGKRNDELDAANARHGGAVGDEGLGGPSTVKRVISGGQTGADRQGIEWAKGAGLETGGVAPKRFYTEAGEDITLRDDFGLTEIDDATTAAYKGREKKFGPRTEQNILQSDVTIIFGDASSAGSRLTKNLADQHGKPIIVNPTGAELREFVARHGAESVNIAGNRAAKLKKMYPQGINAVLEEGLGAKAASGAAKADKFTAKELRFMDEVSGNPALLRMVDEGRLSTTAAFPTAATYAAKHATRLKELRSLRSATAKQRAAFQKSYTPERFLEEADDIGRAKLGPEDTSFQPTADILEEGKAMIQGLRGGIPKSGAEVAEQFSPMQEFNRRTAVANRVAAGEANDLLNKYPDAGRLTRKSFEEVTEEGMVPRTVKPYSFAENGNMHPRNGTAPPPEPIIPQPTKPTPEGVPDRTILETPPMRRYEDHVPYQVVIERPDGTRMQVPSTLFDVPEYSMISLGLGSDIGTALRHSSANGGGRTMLKGADANANAVSQMMGHQVSIGPQNINGAIQGQLKTQTPAKMAAAFKWYDNIHTLMKFMATSLRLPLDFHTANIMSSIPQAMMEDIGPTNMLQGMLATGRLLSKDANEILGLDKVSAVMQGGKINPQARKTAFSKLFTTLHDVGMKGRVKAGAVRESAELASGSESMIYRGGGNAHHYDDIIAAMVEEGAFDTMVRADFVQISKADTALEHIRNLYQKKSGFRTANEAKDRFAEASELFVRFSAMHGAINAGMDLRTAAKSVSKAMVDYSDITQIEKHGLKRIGFFYTFPRKMIPKSLEYLFNNPSKGGALLNNVIKDKEHVKTSEGRIEIAIGDKRVNVGRLAPQIDSMVALASVADTFLPALGNMIPYGDPRPRRMTGEAAPDRPITPSGILNIGGWEQFLPTEDPLSGSMDWLEEASRANWAIKMLTGEYNLLGSRDPEVEYSPLEALARTVTPYRKVRPAQEEQQMIRRINAHKRRYKRELEEATEAGNVTAMEAYTEFIEKMDTRVTELQNVVDLANRAPNPYAE